MNALLDPQKVEALLDNMSEPAEAAKWDAAWKSFHEWQSELFSSPPADELRFKVGDDVRCHLGPSQWAKGSVAKLWYREERWPQPFLAPYQVRLDDGNLIFAPVDCDTFIISAAGRPPTEQALEHDAAMLLGWPEDRSDRDEWKQFGYTELHVCCMAGPDNSEALKALLRRPLMSVDDQQNRYRETPLHIAVNYQRLECVKLLLAAGADPNLTNAHGQDAVDLAKKSATRDNHYHYSGAEDTSHILQLVLRVGHALSEEEANAEEEDAEPEPVAKQAKRRKGSARA
eukprot:478294-Prymnesium_polylepis.1